MKRFSLRRAGEAAGRTARRFPLVLLAAVVAAVAAVVSVDAPNTAYGWRSAMMSALLGIPLFLVLALVAERGRQWKLPRATVPLASLLGAALLVIYAFSLPRHLRETDLYLYAQFAVAAHLLVAVLPFAARGEVRGMWQYNLALLLRFINAVFFSAVLFGGLSLALVAIDTLLGVHVEEDHYLRLWFLLAFVFNTAYFLGGVPERLADLDAVDARPKIVRVFAQSILAPLVVVYLAILLVYLVKVLVTAAWPSGWIGYLVSSVAVAGLLSLLLLKAETERPDRRWVRIYARLFHVLMVPAVAMLALAIFKRIGQYGVTEPRYFLVVLTLWLAAVVAVGCWRPAPALKAIPASLAALALLTAVGPWSAYAVAHRSQLARLETLLAAQSRFADGLLVPAESTVAPRDEREISGLFFYLFDHFGADALGDRADATLREELAAEAVRAKDESAPGSGLAAIAAEHVNLQYTSRWRPDERGDFACRRRGLPAAVPVAGWDHVVSFYLSSEGWHDFTLAGDTLRLSVDWPAESLVLTRAGEAYGTFAMAEMLARLRAFDREVGGGDVPDSLLEATTTAPPLRLKLRVDDLWWSEDDAGRPDSGTLNADLLIGLPGAGAARPRE